MDNKKVLFMYHVRPFMCGEETKYIIYEDGSCKTFNFYRLDVEKDTDFEKKRIQSEKDKERVKNKITHFLEKYKKEIDTLPKKIINDEVLDGCEEEITFGEKTTKGINFLVPVTDNSKKKRSIKKMIKLVAELKKEFGLKVDKEWIEFLK